MEKPDVCNQKIDEYLKGAFAEWEPIPDWFKDLFGEKGENV